jgi:hypothetical protein
MKITFEWRKLPNNNNLVQFFILVCCINSQIQIQTQNTKVTNTHEHNKDYFEICLNVTRYLHNDTVVIIMMIIIIIIVGRMVILVYIATTATQLLLKGLLQLLLLLFQFNSFPVLEYLPTVIAYDKQKLINMYIKQKQVRTKFKCVHIRNVCNGPITRPVESHRASNCVKFRFVFWVILPCKIIVDRRFIGTCCLHHQGDESSQYIPEDKSELHTRCRESLKSHTIVWG